MSITIKEKRFADEYIMNPNAESAAIKAGYSERYARGNAYKLLERPRIKEYIQERLKQLDDDMIMKQDEILKRLTKIARRQEQEYIVVTLSEERSEWIDGRKQTIKTEIPKIVEIPARISDTNKALELLGKTYAIFTDKVDLSEPISITIKRKEV